MVNRGSHQMRTRHGLREIEIDFGAFDYSATCVVGPLKNLPKYVQWSFSDKSFTIDRQYEGLFLARDGRSPILWIPRKPRSPKDMGTLVHECMHLVHYVMTWANIRLTDDTDEVYGHTIGHVVGTILKGLK